MKDILEELEPVKPTKAEYLIIGLSENLDFDQDAQGEWRVYFLEHEDLTKKEKTILTKVVQARTALTGYFVNGTVEHLYGRLLDKEWLEQGQLYLGNRSLRLGDRVMLFYQPSYFFRNKDWEFFTIF